MKKRKVELELTNKVYITPEHHELLRRMKRSQRKSMARIVCDLIQKEYEREVSCLTTKESLKDQVRALAEKHLQ